VKYLTREKGKNRDKRIAGLHRRGKTCGTDLFLSTSRCHGRLKNNNYYWKKRSPCYRMVVSGMTRVQEENGKKKDGGRKLMRKGKGGKRARAFLSRVLSFRRT